MASFRHFVSYSSKTKSFGAHLYVVQLARSTAVSLRCSSDTNTVQNSEVDSRQNYSRVRTSNLTEFVSASLLLDIFVP